MGIIMKASLSVVAFSATVLVASAAHATTVDFDTYPAFAPPGQSYNFAPVLDTFGDTAEVNVTYRSVFGAGFTDGIADEVTEFWNGSYSGHNAVFAAQPSFGEEVRLDAAPGKKITNVTFNFGAWPNVDRAMKYGIYDQLGNLIVGTTGSATQVVSGQTGFTVAVFVNSSSAILRFIETWNTGITSFSYETANVSSVPLPAALPLLGFALGGLGFARRRKAVALSA
jgi:hypothetical protein